MKKAVYSAALLATCLFTTTSFAYLGSGPWEVTVQNTSGSVIFTRVLSSSIISHDVREDFGGYGYQNSYIMPGQTVHKYYHGRMGSLQPNLIMEVLGGDDKTVLGDLDVNLPRCGAGDKGSVLIDSFQKSNIGELASISNRSYECKDSDFNAPVLSNNFEIKISSQ